MAHSWDKTLADLDCMEKSLQQIETSQNRYGRRHYQTQYDEAFARIVCGLGRQVEVIQLLQENCDPLELIKAMRIYSRAMSLNENMDVNQEVKKPIKKIVDGQRVFLTQNGKLKA